MKMETLNAIEAEVSQIRALLEVVCDTVCSMDFGNGETRNHDLDRVNDLAAIAYRLSGLTIQTIEKSYQNREGKA